MIVSYEFITICKDTKAISSGILDGLVAVSQWVGRSLWREMHGKDIKAEFMEAARISGHSKVEKD